MRQTPPELPGNPGAVPPERVGSRPSSGLFAGFKTAPWFMALLLVLLAGAVFLCYQPFTRPLRGDLGQFAYSSRILAAGYPLYKTVFEIKTGLSFMLGALAIRAGESIGIPSLIALRLMALSVAIACVVLTFLVARMFLRAGWAAFVAAVIFLGFGGFAQLTATGLEPKIVMLLFGLGALALGARRHMFWGGVCAACAGLTWQVGWLYVPALFVVEWFDSTRGRSESRRALLSAFAGLVLPLVAYGLGFFVWGAWREMWVESFWLPLTLGRTLPVWSIFDRVALMARRFQTGYPYEVFFVLAALLGWGIYLVRCISRRTLRQEIHDRNRVGVLFAFHAFSLFALVDFQGWPDWVPLLPYLALWCAWLLEFAVEQIGARLNLRTKVRGLHLALIVLAAVLALYDVFLLPTKMRYTWQAQAAYAARLEQQLAPGAPIWFLGAPELLFFFNRPNANRYVLMTYHADVAMQSLEPDGFPGVLDALRAQPPQLIALHRWRARNWARADYAAALLQWVRAGYTPLPDCAEAGGAGLLALSQMARAFENVDCVTQK